MLLVAPRLPCQRADRWKVLGYKLPEIKNIKLHYVLELPVTAFLKDPADPQGLYSMYRNGVQAEEHKLKGFKLAKFTRIPVPDTSTYLASTKCAEHAKIVISIFYPPFSQN